MSAVKGLVIIDSGVQDAKQIINKLPSGTEWVILDQNSSGLPETTVSIYIQNGIRYL